MVKASIIEAKFNRYQGEVKNLFVYRKAPETIRRSLDAALLVPVAGEPILVYYPSAHYYWVLATEGITLFSDGHGQTIRYQTIDGIDSSFLDQPKGEVDSMGLRLKEGTSFLMMEKKTWPVVYGILKFILTSTSSLKTTNPH